ncbi:protein of unknown function [Candidatus Nitrotoga arctica]|uniref:Uncharacterized protein n=1 Tax=Candidatus Nitrotoga arctica TaxID=453162 RepID=A0ABM8YYJ8_9PROT|nr:protein of unknown function [Candidatus Nitrotoga arctica]
MTAFACENVSILAHPEGRALLGLDATQSKALLVSILAHPEGRALLVNPEEEILVWEVSILAHPEGRALRFSYGQWQPCLVFQSSPIPKDGRYKAHSFALLPDQCFNPRPSRRTGATHSESA